MDKINEIAHVMRIPSMKSKQPKPQTPSPKKVPKNYYIDQEVASLFETYCKANRQVVSASREIEDAMIRTILKKGRVYGLRLPVRLT